ncbi:hypothetical protein TNCV_4668041 [Trichonephila clavipes]|nr:hypothetical protein TNCV_4668041 [Trichonephila clavipes]
MILPAPPATECRTSRLSSTYEDLYLLPILGSCDRRLCRNNRHTCKDPCTTLNYCVVPAWITRRPLTSRETLLSLLAGCNEMLNGAAPGPRAERRRAMGEML